MRSWDTSHILYFLFLGEQNYQNFGKSRPSNSIAQRQLSALRSHPGKGGNSGKLHLFISTYREHAVVMLRLSPASKINRLLTRFSLTLRKWAGYHLLPMPCQKPERFHKPACSTDTRETYYSIQVAATLTEGGGNGRPDDRT